MAALASAVGFLSIRSSLLLEQCRGAVRSSVRVKSVAWITSLIVTLLGSKHLTVIAVPISKEGKEAAAFLLFLSF